MVGRNRFILACFLVALGTAAALGVATLVIVLPAIRANWASDPVWILPAVAAWALTVFFLVRLLLVVRRGRLPTIDDSVLLPEPPPTLTPAMTLALRSGKVNCDALGVALADLADRGLIGLRDDDTDNAPTVFVRDRSAALPRRTRPLGAPESGLLEEMRKAAGPDAQISREELEAGTGQALFGPFQKALAAQGTASGWFTRNPLSALRTWLVLGWGMAIPAFCAFFYELAQMPIDQDPLAMWSFSWLFVCGLVIVFGAYGLYDNRTGAGAYQLAMAEAYGHTLRRILAGSSGGKVPEETLRRSFPWLSETNELFVWALALGLNAEKAYSQLPIVIDRESHSLETFWNFSVLADRFVSVPSERERRRAEEAVEQARLAESKSSDGSIGTKE